MPKFQTLLHELNIKFSPNRVGELVTNKSAFAPGQPLDTALATLLAKPGTTLFRTFKAYLAKTPGSISEALRSTIYYVLSTTPPTPITFSWAPAYDYEITVWHAPDTKSTRGGVTVLLKSRYPDDRHPLASG